MASFEITVARADCEPARRDRVAIHGDTHRATRLSPFSAGSLEDVIETYCLGFVLDALRARNDEHSHVIRYAVTFDDTCCRFEIAEARVRAAADENHINGCAGELLAGLDLHVVEGFCEGFVVARRGRYRLVDCDDHARVRAERDHRLHRRDIEADFPVERCIWIARQLAPTRNGRIPCLAFGGHLATGQVLESRIVRRHHPCAGTGFDGHVADRHSLVHRQRADGRAAVFHGVSRATVDTDLPDDAQHDVLGRHAPWQRAV